MREEIDSIIERLQGAKACISLSEMYESEAEKHKAAMFARDALLDDAKVLLDELLR